MSILKGKNVLITGATSGIGKSAAVKFAECKSNLILLGRRKDRLMELSAQLIKEFEINIECIQADVRDFKSLSGIIEYQSELFKTTDILVNNAGLARGFSHISAGDIADWDEMIDTNLKGLLYVSRCIVPFMIKNNSGHVINIGSIAGREVYPNGNVYCATKHAVDAVTKGLRMELVNTDIKVTSIDPGLVETEFSLVRFRGDTEKAGAAYKGMKPLTPDDVAEAIIFAASRNDNFVVAEMVLLPKAQAGVLVIDRKNV
ncbi:MAG TPA: SDR family NAD(P)-dependent oxidoreductase [Ignavibacteria bacterium]|nr:NAD(P)-dependent oxidoreductase [Bacteroidota bacterium]HRI84171.1 SDR family NAD(P)-dependent oxidoreductase [Ignavibacteria bacterium]HRJ97991.1 SDR family NAD(P)-dependent oxidoreductase [Ignavibacteria bacterium]